MFVHRTTLLPLPGKAGELRKLVGEAASERQAQGVAASATCMIAGPEERAGAVHMLMRYPDLDALQKHFDQLVAETGTGVSRFGMAVSPLLRTHISAQIAEVMLPAPAASAAMRYRIRSVARPQTDKFAQAGRAVVRFAELQQKLGFVTSVVQLRLAGRGGFVTNRAHASLGELEESWAAFANPEAQAVLAEVVATLGQPLEVELQESLVEMPG